MLALCVVIRNLALALQVCPGDSVRNETADEYANEGKQSRYNELCCFSRIHAWGEVCGTLAVAMTGRARGSRRLFAGALRRDRTRDSYVVLMSKLLTGGKDGLYPTPTRAVLYT